MVKYPILIFSIILLFLSSCNSDKQLSIQFNNGQWFNGNEFESKSLYSVNGVLMANFDGQPDTIIDLKQGYVVPPFGDAHTHNLADPRLIDEATDKYLQDGVFYIQVLTNYASKADSIRKQFWTEETIDVKYANGGITATLGHPHLAYETSALGLHWSAMFSERDRIKNSRLAANDAYWFLDTTKDVEQKWDSIMSTNPDLIKIYLINTDRHKELLQAEQMGKFGLSEEVARMVVNNAHQAGLKVYAHVENAYDFRVGQSIGVDAFGHLPGYSWDGEGNSDKYLLTDEDIAKTREQNIIVIPTVYFAKVYAMNYDQNGRSSLDSLRHKTVSRFLASQLDRLQKTGVKIALGSDQHGETSILEANYLVNELKVFDQLTVLKLLAETTPQTIYPSRKIGILKEGFEASFLVLNGNPLKNWDYINSINLYVKQGHILNKIID